MHKFSNLLENKVQVLCSVLKLRVLWFIWKVKMLVTQLCLTLCKPMDCSPPNPSVHGISQARILEWVAFPFSKRSSWPGDWTQVSSIAGEFFNIWATNIPLNFKILSNKIKDKKYRPRKCSPSHLAKVWSSSNLD